MKLSAAILLLLFFSNADASFFLDFGLGGLRYSDNNIKDSQFNFSSRAGYAFNQYFELSAEYGVSLGGYGESDNFPIDEIQTVSFFVQTNIALKNSYRIFLLAGTTDVELQDTYDTAFGDFPKETKSQSGASYGIGLQIPMEEANVYMEVEYISFVNSVDFDDSRTDVNLDAINLRLRVYY